MVKKQWRKVLKIVGFTLIAAAVCVIGYSAWNLINTEVDTQKSVTMAEQFLDFIRKKLIDERGAAPPAAPRVR